MIAVTFALPEESSAFARNLAHREQQGATRGALSTFNIALVHTGVGARECEKRLRVFLERDTPQVLISSGFCGATNDQLAPGDVFIGENYSSDELLIKAKRAIESATIGRLFSADRVIDPAADRYAIGRDHGALAIDMETAVIARLCREGGISMLSLRVVTDSPAQPFPAPPQVLFDVPAQRTKFSRLLAHLARDPATAVRLLRFSRQIKAAREKLAGALCHLIAAL